MSYLLLPHGVDFENETKCLAVDIIDFWLMFEKLLNYTLYEKKVSSRLQNGLAEHYHWLNQ